MTTQLSTKLAALGIALLINGMMLGSIAVLFGGQLNLPAQQSSVVQVSGSVVTREAA